MTAVFEPEHKLFTAEDIERLDGWGFKYELVNGELLSMSSLNRNHGRAIARVVLAIGNFVDNCDLGETHSCETWFKFSQSPDTVLVPDFAFVRRDHVTENEARGFFSDVPDLVVETRRPRASAVAVRTRLQRWLDADVPFILDLDPKRRILTVLRRGEQPLQLGLTDTLLGYEVLPGFSLPMSCVFG